MTGENFMAVLNCAFEEKDMEMFEYLTRNYDSMKRRERNEILITTTRCAPDAAYLRHLVEKGADLGYQDKDGNTLLHHAAASSSEDTVQYLIDGRLNLEAKNIAGDTPLYIAALESDNLAVLKTLIAAEADINVRSNDGETLLIAAAGRNPSEDITRHLLKLGLNPNDRDDAGYTAVLNAARWQSNASIIDILVDAGANIHDTAANGDTAFHLAAKNPSPNVAHYIMDSFLTSERNNEGMTCIETALMYAKSDEVVALYLRKQKEEQFFRACMNEDFEIPFALIRAGYDVNTASVHGTTALMTAALHCTDISVILMFFVYGAVTDCRDKKGRNFLHYAAANQNAGVDFYESLRKDSRCEGLESQTDLLGNKPEYYRSHKDEF